GQEADRAQRPALLMVAGLEGDDLAGTASALAWIEQLVSQHEQANAVRQLLDSTTIYVLPRLNPDAAESYFAKPQVAQTTNRRPT
ncbi:peptidase M14, partial [Citrobacter sp. AAK_AS5]